MPQKHELLNRGEFKQKLSSVYNDRTLGNLFGYLIRTSLGPGAKRTSSDIGYEEIARNGTAQVMLSVPNLAANLDEVQTLPHIGPRYLEICKYLIHMSMQDAPADK